MIQLGLTRISRLLEHSSLSWPAIHVAGTNGKGSVCAYASAMLRTQRLIKAGKFTSPHLIDRWDCIAIDERPIEERIFLEVERSVKAKNESCNIQATEFELLTATAFEIFSREQIDLGVIEVGMGGGLDATNILPNSSVTVITKIGLDHQAFLGDTIEEIASHKAGIMKKGVPCIMDGTNPPSVLDVFRKHAHRVQAGPVIPIRPMGHKVWDTFPQENFEDHQQVNICLAVEAVTTALSVYPFTYRSSRELLSGIPKAVLPGRLQKLSIKHITGRKSPILLDGAHNVQSAEVLGNYVDKHLRQSDQPVTWLVAFSKGKDIPKILSVLVRQGDIVLPTGFDSVDSMPWVQSAEREQIVHACRELSIPLQQKDTVEHLDSIVANESPLVVTGSLYLVSDILRRVSLRSNKRSFW